MSSSGQFIFGLFPPALRRWRFASRSPSRSERSWPPSTRDAIVSTFLLGIVAFGASPIPPQLIHPADGASFDLGDYIAVTVDPSGLAGTIERVEFFIDETLVGTDHRAPFSHVLTDLATGAYEVHAVAYDASDDPTPTASSALTVSGSVATGFRNSDRDVLPDWFEILLIDANLGDALNEPKDVYAGDDFDQDGVSNYYEYAFALDGADASASRPLSFGDSARASGPDWANLDLGVRRDDPALAYRIRLGSDLATWKTTEFAYDDQTDTWTSARPDQIVVSDWQPTAMGDGLLSLASGPDYADTSSLFVQAGLGSDLRFLPRWFSNGTLPVTVFYDASQPLGSRWTTDYDKNDWIGKGTRYFVNAIGGSDITGDGSTATPWASIAHAVTQVASGDVIEIASGRYGPVVIPAWAHISLVAEDGATVILGDLLTEADITWGAQSGAYQTATSASGKINGFTDLTQSRNGYPAVARQVADTIAGDVRKAQGYPAFVTGTSQFSAVDGRDLSGLANTELLIWTDDSASPAAFESGGSLYMEGLILAGGHISTNMSSTLVLENCWYLGGVANLVSCRSDSIISNCCIRGASVDDVVEYYADASYAELNSVIDHSGEGKSDDASTTHDYACGVRLGCIYEGRRAVHDISYYPGLIVECMLSTWDDFGQPPLMTGSNYWIQNLSFDAATGSRDISGGDDVYLIDEEPADYDIALTSSAKAIAIDSFNLHGDTPAPMADISTMSPLVWYEASSLVSAANKVTAWNDLSGNEVHLSNEGTEPILETVNDRDVAHMFPGEAMVAASTGLGSAINASQAFTVHAIVNLDELNTRGMISIGSYDNGLDMYLLVKNGTTLLTVKLKSGGSQTSQVNADIRARNWAHVCITHAGNTFSVYTDRDLSAGTNSTPLTFEDGLQVNRRGLSSTNGTAAYAELAVWDRALTATEITMLRQRAILLYGARR